MVTILRRKDRQVFEFDNELEFKQWLVKQGRKCKVKRIGVEVSKSNLDTRQLRFQGNGGDKSFVITNKKFHK